MDIDISVFFARLWGGFFLIFGLLFLVSGFLGKVIEMSGDRSFTVSTGYISLLMGLVTVILHSLWVADWRIAITLLGWSTLIKGVMKIGFPDVIHRQAQAFKRRQWIDAVLLMGLGGWLLWMSFQSA